MIKLLFSICAVLFSLISFSQVEKEVAPPFNIKTISFVQNGQNIVPIVELGDAFQLQFDDLNGDEANYYYTITYCDYDWKPTELSKNTYLNGFDDLRIQDYSNSQNTLQSYSHFRLSLPNKNTQFLLSGNYVIKILNENKEIVFSKKIILYEDLLPIPAKVRRARNLTYSYQKHNLEFSINPTTTNFINPLERVKVMLLQNGKFDNAITNIKPQFTIGNELLYKYDSETQFWAGNEFLYFENKDARVSGNNIAYVDRKTDLYSAHLLPNHARGNTSYTNYPDINGNFLVQKLNATDNEVETDYVWVYFTLSAPSFYLKKSIYINGMFNNYAIGEENKMDYNEEKGVYEKALLIKQGFTNFQYVIADDKGKIDEENAIDGNFYQTENNYFVLVYYRENNKLYDRVIGKGNASSLDITN